MKAIHKSNRDGSERVMLGKVIWAEKPAHKRAHRLDWQHSKEFQRLREIEKVIRHRHGGMIPDPASQEAAKNVPQAFQVLGRRPQRPGQGGSGPSAWDRFLYGAASDPNFSFKDHMGISRGGAVPPEVTNNSTDNRDQSVKVDVGGVTVQGVQNVNAAVGGAIGRAVGQAAVARVSRFERDDAF